MRVVLLLLLASACGGGVAKPDAAQSEAQGAAGYRCILAGGASDTDCSSMPANCPVRIPHQDTPRCPQNATLVPQSQDHCSRHLLCVD